MKILVIGDSCVDVFIYGKCERLCPDAPVPVFIPNKTEKTGGMSMNVYENILSLGFECDLVTNKKKVTKTRYIDEKTNHMFLRVDSEKTLSPRIDNLTEIDLKNYEAIIISDYNKGFLTYEDIRYICENHDLVFIDTKKLINFNMLSAKYIKINEVEYNNNLSLGNLSSFADKMIITLGSQGAKHLNRNFKVKKVEMKDSSGAGDTFISALVVEYCRSRDIFKSIEFANKCSTIVVQHKGVNKVGEFMKI
jgi:D-beta-D-heptose 7-phosphate kinase/D-beta-D-heptose 1-phosphate adenosyltransferase